MTPNQPIEDIVVKRSPLGPELLATPHTSRISWTLLNEAGEGGTLPFMTIADGEITLRGCNTTAVYRIVSAERPGAVVELVHPENPEEK